MTDIVARAEPVGPGVTAAEFRASVRRFLDETSPISRVRTLMESEDGFDIRAWRRGATELGLPGLAVPETFGGRGAGLDRLGIAFEEFGRSLVCAPYFSTVALSVSVLAHATAEAVRHRYLAPLAMGRAFAALAWGGPDPLRTTLLADGGRVSGSAEVVVEGMNANMVFVLARAGDRLQLLAIEESSRGISRTELTAMDTTRRLARVDFFDAEAHVLADDCAAGVALGLDHAALLLAAEQLGGAQRCLEDSVAYAKDRRQFGRAIGSFQAVKHRCADMLVDIELARSLLHHALARVDGDPAAAAVEAPMVRAFVCEVFLRAAHSNMQIHGGLGFTWDHSAHLFLKRARSSQSLLAGPEAERRRLAEALGIVGGTR